MSRLLLHPLIWLLTAVVGVSLLAAPPIREPRDPQQKPLLPRADFLHVIGAAHQNLVADYFWLQTIQALGRARTEYEYRDIYYYADLTTDLDPQFRQVYAFAGPSIAYNLGREQWVNTRESTLIVEKGLNFFPDNVFLRMLLGYNLSYFDKDYRRAAEVLRATAGLPGAPSYLASLATRLYAHAGDIDAGLAFAETLAENSTDPANQELFKKRIMELELERDLQQVDAAAEKYRARTGSLPTTVMQLVATGDLPKLPIDPFGGAILIGEDGKARSTAHKKRLERFDPLNRRQELDEE